MPDIFLRPGEASPNDIRLRDTTTADSGGSFTSTATWDQAPATWQAAASLSVQPVVISSGWVGRVVPRREPVPPAPIRASATFVQAAASWSASVTIGEDPDEWLVLGLELVAA